MITVPRLWPDQTVICLATGPSLTQADCDAVRGQRVIAINDAHRLAPWADVLYSSDRQWWPFYKGVPAFGGLKYGVGSLPGGSNPFHQCPDVQVLKNTGEDGLELQPTGLKTYWNSGGAAINLAVHLGAARIVLLGYDMGGDHFFGAHPSRLNQQSPFRAFVRLMATMVEPLKALGVVMLNASRQTALKCFPRVSLASALSAVAA